MGKKGNWNEGPKSAMDEEYMSLMAELGEGPPPPNPPSRPSQPVMSRGKIAVEAGSLLALGPPPRSRRKIVVGGGAEVRSVGGGLQAIR